MKYIQIPFYFFLSASVSMLSQVQPKEDNIVKQIAQGPSPVSLKTVEEVEQWAKIHSLGYNSYKFIHEKFTFVIVIGAHKSGNMSSEITVFRNENGEFKPILTRATVDGFYMAKEMRHGINIVDKEGNLLLFMPWFGLEQ